MSKILFALVAVSFVNSDAPPHTGTGQTGVWHTVRAFDLKGGTASRVGLHRDAKDGEGTFWAAHRQEQGAVAISPDQEFAVVCGSDGRITILRVTLYPNLYPDWPYLVYGWHPPPGVAAAPDPTQDVLAGPVHCSMSRGGARVLSVRPSPDGGATATLFARGSRTEGLRRFPLQCGPEHPAWDSSSFHIKHPRDPYDDEWAPLRGIVHGAKESSGGQGGGVMLSAALSPDGEWIAAFWVTQAGGAAWVTISACGCGDVARQPQAMPSPCPAPHPGGNPGANLRSISRRCHLFEVAFAWVLTKETIHLPVGCLHGGVGTDHPPC